MPATQLWLLLAAPVCMTFALRGRLPEFAAPRSRVRASWSIVLAASAGACATVALETSTLAAAGALAFLCVLARLAMIDAIFMAIPVRMTVTLGAAGVVLAWLDGGLVLGAVRFLVAIMAWAGFRLLDILFVQLRGRSGLGAGDALIAAAIGAWLGPLGLAWSVAIAGASTLLWAAAFGRLRSGAPFAFAPGLAVGAFGALIGRRLLAGEAWTW